ncbi:SKG6 domain-containing protein [Phanerochaete sordida]|uniref:SKG6 domain-containing protein n=1 Tax=Phanerochaete sordida TaxID=48140 RepID=A0A9P3G509_9APHY|nr:SKG6 domain-containing protein [Phanerochaete sordida]
MPVMPIRLALLPTILLSSLFSTTLAANFTFDFGTPTQCDNFPVSWTGGSPPFELVLAPEFGTPRTFPVPSSSYTNGKGSFQAQIPFPKDHKFLAIMSDASGFGSGGATTELTVGAAVSNTNCNTTDPGVDFFFELNTALQQCRPYTFDNYTGAVQPVTIMGVIPGGETFVLDPPTGPTTYEWIADLAGGSNVMWIMSDSQGRKGGSSDVKLVGISDDTTCLNANSPTSLSVMPSATASLSASSAGASSSAAPGDASGGSSKTSSDTGAIVGGVFAGLFAIATIIAVTLFFLRRRKNRSTSYYDENYKPRRGGRLESVDLDAPVAMEDGHAASVISPYPYAGSVASLSQAGGRASTHNMAASSHQLLPMGASASSQHDRQTEYDTNLTNPYSAPSESAYSRHRPSGSELGGMSTADRSSTYQGAETASMTSSARRKAAMAGETTYRPTRFIVHQDLEEAVPEDEGEVVELPPQYSERRAPLPSLTNYATPPPGSPPRAVNPLEVEEAGSSTRLQEPLQPATPTIAGSPVHHS